MKSSKPENLELSQVTRHLHLVSSEPVLSTISSTGPATPTIKLSAALVPGLSDPGQVVTTSSSAATSATLPISWSALKKHSQNNKLTVQNVNTIAVQPADSSDISPASEQNDLLSVTTTDRADMLSVVSSNQHSSLMSSSISMSSTGDSGMGLLSLLPIKTRFATLSVADSLMPPEGISFNAKRHNSLPGTIDHLSPLHALNGNGKQNGKRNGKHNGGNRSQPSSPSHAPTTWERMFGKKRSDNSNGNAAGATDYSSAGEMSDASCYSLNSQDEEALGAPPKQRLQLLVKSVRDKMRRVGNNSVSPAPSSLLAPPQPAISTRKRLDSFAPSSIVDSSTAEEIHFKGFPCCRHGWRALVDKIRLPTAVDPLGSGWLLWLFLVAWAYIYNAIVIFLRCSFPVQTASNFWVWFIFDYMCDAIYILDMVFRMRLIYFHGGAIITDAGLMRTNYFRSSNFKYDVLSLLPLDIFYVLTGVSSTPAEMARGAATQSILLRLPRLIKAHSYVEFVEKYENKTTSPNICRVVQSVGLLLYMIHLNTCMYYVVSVWEGIGMNDWVYHGDGIAYVRCLYRAAKTLITIGNLPRPVTTFEIFFMNVDFLVGIFVFATIIGQMRDIVGNAGATRGAFRTKMDNTMALLKLWKIPNDIQKRVRLWYMYSWDRKELVDELEAIKGVPIKMQTDLAIHVHMETLSKVKLFQDCDKMLLRDLVLKLRPVLYLPRDYICRKGEVGKEMFIIKSGCVQVVGGEDNRTVLATLHSGSYFGEISLLSVGSGNRRTADVYSPGYANLFLLDKKTLQEVIVAYPDAQESLKKQAREILKKNQANDTTAKKKRGKSLIAESILKSKGLVKSEGNFFSTVLAAARNQKISSTILKGSFRSSMGSQSSIAIFSASDFSSDDEVFNDRPKRRKFKRRKSRRRSKSAIPQSTSADVHAGISDSEAAYSAAEKGLAFDNKGYISTDAESGVDGKQAATSTHQTTSTEEAIADILDETEVSKKDSNEGKKKKKLILQKQTPVDETTSDDNDMFSKSSNDVSGAEDTKKKSHRKSRQFTFDERDEDEDEEEEDRNYRMTPLQQFTFDEGDEEYLISRNTEDEDEDDDDGDTVSSLPGQFTFDEMDEDIKIPPLRQFTFDDSEDSDTQIEEASRKMSKGVKKMSQSTAVSKETNSETDSTSKDDALKTNDDEEVDDKPKMSKAHAERIRIRQRQKPISLGSLTSKGSRGSIRRSRSNRSLGSVGKKAKGKSIEAGNKEGVSSKTKADVGSLDCSLSWDTTSDDEMKIQETGQRRGKEMKKGLSERKDSSPGAGKQRRIGMMRRLPPISLDSSLERLIDDDKMGMMEKEGRGKIEGKGRKEDESDEEDRKDDKGGKNVEGQTKKEI